MHGSRRSRRQLLRAELCMLVQLQGTDLLFLNFCFFIRIRTCYSLVLVQYLNCLVVSDSFLQTSFIPTGRTRGESLLAIADAQLIAR